MKKAAKKPQPRKRRGKRAKPAQTPAETPVVALVPQEHGGALKQGGTHAGGGRPSNDIRDQCIVALAECKGLEVVKGIVTDGKDRDRLVAVGMLLDRGYGKASQKIEVENQGRQGSESGEQVMTRVLSMIGRALLAAPAAQRLAVISEIERGEVVNG